LPIPQPGPTDVLVKLSVTGLCGTDFALASGALGQTRPILGHEGIGRVSKLGSALNESQVKLGQRVGISWVRGVCGDCAFCLHEGGEGEAHCAAQIHSGRKVDGTLAGFTVVPFDYISMLPEGLEDAVLAPVMCGGVTAYKALKLANVVPGAWVVLLGAGGGVGSLGIQYARAMGYRVIAVDAGSEKEEACLELGASVYVDINREGLDIARAVKGLTDGKGASAVIVIAGSARAYQDAFHLVAPFGTLVCVGITPLSEPIQVHPLTLIDNGIRVIGSMTGTRQDIVEAVEFVRRGEVVPEVQIIPLKIMEGIGELRAQNKVSHGLPLLTIAILSDNVFRLQGSWWLMSLQARNKRFEITWLRVPHNNI
ncbi:hypothetical protein ASPVEDRAFT_125961, partial [Aspergillus versicolor CBS 583.65]